MTCANTTTAIVPASFHSRVRVKPGWYACALSDDARFAPSSAAPFSSLVSKRGGRVAQHSPCRSRCSCANARQPDRDRMRREERQDQAEEDEGPEANGSYPAEARSIFCTAPLEAIDGVPAGKFF